MTYSTKTTTGLCITQMTSKYIHRWSPANLVLARSQQIGGTRSVNILHFCNWELVILISASGTEISITWAPAPISTNNPAWELLFLLFWEQYNFPRTSNFFIHKITNFTMFAHLETLASCTHICDMLGSSKFHLQTMSRAAEISDNDKIWVLFSKCKKFGGTFTLFTSLEGM